MEKTALRVLKHGSEAEAPTRTRGQDRLLQM